jgi:alpha-L-fucosidase
MSDLSYLSQIKELKKIGAIGFIFHVGLYSFYGYDDIKSARRRKMQNGSEWFLERIQEREYRPISGSKESKVYFSKFGSNYNYFKAPFYVNRESICEWLDLCVKCKASYVFITAKHHDSFCLWPTKTTKNCLNYDLIQIFKEETEKRNIVFGIYYSWYEFLNPMTIDFFDKICVRQLGELLKYNPKFFWFDGDWVCKSKYIINKIKEIVIYLRSIGILVNDRITSENSNLAGWNVIKDRYIPEKRMENWQHVNTIGLSWGYNRDQEKDDFKTGLDLYNLLIKVMNLGGTFLLNLGPKHDGSLDVREVESLIAFSELLR